MTKSWAACRLLSRTSMPRKDTAEAAGGVIDLLQLGDLGPARPAPLAPHVDDDDLAGERARSLVQREGARRIHQVRPGKRAGAAAARGRVIEDVGLAAGRDEFEGAALRYRIASRTAREKTREKASPTAPAIASRHLLTVKRPPVGSTPRRPAGRRRKPRLSAMPARIPVARVVPEPLTGQVQPQRPYRQLVADAHHLVAGRRGRVPCPPRSTSGPRSRRSARPTTA